MSTLTHRLLRAPGTWVVVLVASALCALSVWWFQPPPMVALGFVALGVACVLAWPLFFVRSASWRAADAAARQRIDGATVARIQALEADLRALGADSAVHQLRGLREKLQSLTNVLEKRLNAGELAYGRYLATAEQVYLSAVDNLQEVAVSLTGIASIDPGWLDARLAELESGGGTEERASLLERRALLHAQTDKIARLMSQNETAMTALAKTSAALADVRTARGDAHLDAATAMSELELLAQRAQHFDVSR